ncbi:MAG TPA: AAA family ATPase [Phycisphaerae bacterium]|nr:AAA family ATPase [Phycisphaerae bacterium]
MYRNHWSLQQCPFEAVPDSRFFFPTAEHEHALGAIQYAACDGGEPVLLSGRTGCGKTLLLRTLRRRLPPERYHVAFVPETACAQVGLLRRVAYHLAHASTTDAGAAMDVIAKAFQQAEHHSQTVVLMLDDWPVDAGRQTLAELRWLLNPDVEDTRVCVLLSCAEVTSSPPWPSWLTQRLLATAQLAPLQQAEIPGYLGHRLRVAGHSNGELFTPEAGRLVAEWSGGVPRLVNRAAHLALHVGCLNLAERVEESAVRQALSRLTQFSAASAPTAELYAGAES